MARNGKVILSKGIKLDKSYKQVLSYSESALINLMSDSSHLVSLKSDYNFIRESGTITVQETYSTCLKANYMAFQNTDFSGKWFFAFIDKVRYINNTTTEIYYTIDIWSTWFDYWNPTTCYIERQHAVTDTIGSNTVPEGLEHGEYVGSTLTNKNYVEANFQDCFMVLNVAEAFDDSTVGVVNVGNTYITGYLYVTRNPLILKSMVDQVIATEGNQILGVYLVPEKCFDSSSLVEVPVIGGSYYRVNSWNTTISFIKSIMNRSNLDLDGYVPVNKKLLTYPYIYCLMTNNAGGSNMLKFEDYANGSISIKYYCVPTLGGSIIAVPFGYKNITENFTESLVAGKFPTLGWSEDSYTNWLTQNAVNNSISKGKVIAGGVISAGMIAGGIALTTATGGAGSMMGASLIGEGAGHLIDTGSNAIDLAKEYHEHEIEPDSYKGNINGGDVLTAIEYNTFVYRAMTIKYEWAERLDKFFTRFGYKQNKIDYPNMLHRQNYNYVKISKDSTTAYSNNHNNICVPALDLEIINGIFRNGVTVWNNHNNFGDYSVSNNITS